MLVKLKEDVEFSSAFMIVSEGWIQWYMSSVMSVCLSVCVLCNALGCIVCVCVCVFVCMCTCMHACMQVYIWSDGVAHLEKCRTQESMTRV